MDRRTDLPGQAAVFNAVMYSLVTEHRQYGSTEWIGGLQEEHWLWSPTPLTASRLSIGRKRIVGHSGLDHTRAHTRRIRLLAHVGNPNTATSSLFLSGSSPAHKYTRTPFLHISIRAARSLQIWRLQAGSPMAHRGARRRRSKLEVGDDLCILAASAGRRVVTRDGLVVH